MFGRRKNRVNSDTLTSDETAREYGHPGEHFDFPYQVTEDDAYMTEYSFGPEGGVPRPVAVVDDATAYAVMKDSMPNQSGRGGIRFRNIPADQPSNDEASINPAPGSHDLERPMDTPMFAPATNRSVVLDGPVIGGDVVFSGQVATIGQQLPGQNGPVTGDGGGYSSQLAASYFAALAQQYSAEASASAMVSAV